MPVIDKQALLAALIAQLRERLAQTHAMAAHAAASATHEEARAEDKYDTRGLEMSYMAAGANDRAEALRRVLGQYQFWQLPDGALETIVAGALVELVDDDEAQRWVFIAPYGDGTKLKVAGVEVQIVTLRAPLGRALLNRREGDEISVTVAANKRSWVVEAVL